MSLQCFSSSLLTACSFLVPAATTLGQTVQQPVVEVFGVNTTVSVPDRGAIHLGSVSRAAEGRTTAGFGPFRSRSGYGRELSHSGASAHVYIHDLRAMDAAVLNQAAAMQAMSPREPQLTGYAAHAYSQLTGRPVAATPPAPPAPRGRLERSEILSEPAAAPIRPNTAATRFRPERETQPPTAARPVETEAERFLRLGREAEAAGKAGLAKLHYKAAARHGSREAERLLSGDETMRQSSRLTP